MPRDAEDERQHGTDGDGPREGTQVIGRARLPTVQHQLGEGVGRVGTPFLSGASVTAKVVRQIKGPKVVICKFRKRKNSRRRTGFRARFTEIQIESINA